MDKNLLFNFLKIIGSKLERQITLVAAGGTAMTLLELKNSTIDIDFTGPQSDIEEFNRIQESIPHGVQKLILGLMGECTYHNCPLIIWIKAL